MSMDSSLRRVREQLSELRTLAALPEARLHACHDTTSAWCAAEHLDHLVKVSASILRRLADAKAEALPKGISAVGRAILFLGWIPRGKGKAPERLRGARVSADALQTSINDLQQLLDTFPADAVKRRAGERLLPHPRFGGLTPAQAMRFAAVHNEHHFKIVREVLGRVGSN
ncbi:MAG TPA: DinB family protein [Thermoanaerobaculia bacterium]|nr:DinB family protein [Thermoanaerobaculia bacterium]